MSKKIEADELNLKRRRLFAWLAASLAMPITAYPFISENLNFADLDLPIVLVLGVCWALCSAIVGKYLNNIVK